MDFCPTCANLLLVEGGNMGELRYFCQTCPYVYTIKAKMKNKLPLARKEVDDVLGGEEAWRNVDKTEATCPKCRYGEAYFMQIQIRSADEPMSTFYKCCKPECSHQWREG
ncbi:DNA-directed RNA polymerase III subunit 11 [Klebsormidium nitens]|uniref:DNA-directed RNA polymerase subunit n=1 Tax=Klebsormidium nitens TaxID=105231 RepID=A0A1Y1IMC9_KLENI|nr:DNA-directed RNA polymerase III subunit 11 [Klebsormidium nitens]|eukprot:GAQ90599.1 DNA-directed RNA polymerase III subunit 11 [Klebsormidium nitens]